MISLPSNSLLIGRKWASKFWITCISRNFSATSTQQNGYHWKENWESFSEMPALARKDERPTSYGRKTVPHVGVSTTFSGLDACRRRLIFQQSFTGSLACSTSSTCGLLVPKTVMKRLAIMMAMEASRERRERKENV